jgi:hypothetical protein
MTPKTSAKISLVAMAISLICSLAALGMIWRAHQIRQEARRQLMEEIQKLEKSTAKLNRVLDIRSKSPVANEEPFLLPEEDGLSSPSVQAVIACMEGKGRLEHGSLRADNESTVLTVPAITTGEEYTITRKGALITASLAKAEHSGPPYLAFATDTDSDGETEGGSYQNDRFPDCGHGDTSACIQGQYNEALIAARQDCHV